ncbi:hypothetical protein [Sphaerotilus sp.]|uniref:hypothetical protein n=1 Tax=Sphaerotilus sp. TaxID=2093942 RepID=UPI002ACE0446|nr:hypothetical protein [Sphaerotilus sp.]MDZ7855287.1 hypothetical protein [Sphaerotilus sp.]
MLQIGGFMRFKFSLTKVAFASAVLLSGCGGGGDSSVDQNITGRVADGYISGAIVFWDCNNNMIVDSGEISTNSGAHGVYNISPPPSASCVLRAYVPATAIDEDTNSPVGAGLVLSSVSGSPYFISPLTTLIELGAVTEADLNKTMAGSTVPASKDYIAAGLSGVQNHVAAKYAAEALKAVAGQIVVGDVDARRRIVSNAFSLLPPEAFVSKSVKDQSVYEKFFSDIKGVGRINPLAAFLGTAEFAINEEAFSINDPRRPVVQAALDAIKMHPQVIVGSNIRWGSLPESVRLNFASKLADGNIFPETDEVKKLRDVLFNEAQKAREKINAAKDKSLRAQTVTILNNATDAAMTSVSSAMALFPGPSYAASVARKEVALGKFVDSIKILKTLEKYPKLIESMPDCAKALERAIVIFGYKELELKDGTEVAMSFLKCAKGFTSENMGVIVSAFDAGKSATEIGNAQSLVELLSTLNDVTSSIMDMAGLSVVKAIFDEWDLVVVKRQKYLIDQIRDGNLADAKMQKTMDDVIGSLNSLYEDLGEQLISARLRPYIHMVADSCSGGYLLVKGRCYMAPTVSSVLPIQVVLNQATPFTITGQNLPLTSVLSIADATCQTPTNRTATGFTVVCTPGGAAGSKVVTVKTDTEVNRGEVINPSKSITVTAQTSKYPEGTWYSVSKNILSTENVAKIDGNIVNSQPFGGLFYKLNSPVDADNITFEVSAVFASMPGTYSGYDIAFALNNMFTSGEVDSNNIPSPTRVLQANFRTNGWSDIITAITENGNQAIYIGTTDTRQWHLYKVTTLNGVIGVYVDNVLRYTMPYAGSMGMSSAFTANGLSGIMIDPASLKIYPTR